MTDTAATTTTAPTIFWVVGNGSDVGKTTMATALIRALDAAGRRPVGFKPFGGGSLQIMVDFILATYPGAPSRLFGMDAWALAHAAPLAGPGLVDVVAPVHMLTHGRADNVVLMRTGSAVLGDLAFFCSAEGARLRDRPDVRALADRAGLPFDDATVAETIGMRAGTGDAWAKIPRAFARLLETGADTVVIEGNSRWLPLWPGAPVVDHLMVVANGLVSLVPGIGLDLPFTPDQPVRDGRALNDRIAQAGRPGLSMPLYLADAAHRAALAQQTAQRLLSEAGLLVA